MPPFSGPKQEIIAKHIASCLTYSPTLEIEATCSFETSIEFQRNMWQYTPEDRRLHKHALRTSIPI
jgi:hypothetical protein